MKTYTVPVSWEVFAWMQVRANSLDEAIKMAEDVPLPNDTMFIENSFSIHHEMLSECNIQN